MFVPVWVLCSQRPTLALPRVEYRDNLPMQIRIAKSWIIHQGDSQHSGRSHRADFNWVSKVTSELLWFYITSLSDCFKPKFSRHFFNQSKVKPKPIVARACTFSRALCRLSVISKFSAPTIAFLAFWLAKKLRLWANSRSFTSYGK